MQVTSFAPYRLTEQLQEALAAADRQQMQRVLGAHHPADLANAIDRLAAGEPVQVFQFLSSEVAARVLHELGKETTRHLLAQLPSEQIGDLLDRMPMDEAARILTLEPPQRQDELLALMQPLDAAEVKNLLQYPPQSAGRLLTEKFVRVAPEMTVGSLIPLLAQRFRIDPAVVSAPLITTLVDVTGLAIYLLIAKAILGL